MEKAEAIEKLQSDLEAYFTMNEEFVKSLGRIVLDELSEEEAERIRNEVFAKLKNPLVGFEDECEELKIPELKEGLRILLRVTYQGMDAIESPKEEEKISQSEKYNRIHNLVTSFMIAKGFSLGFLLGS